MEKIVIKRIYEPAADDDGLRVLIDRVWPRGVSKSAAKIDLWARELAPSTPLRKWFNHDPGKWTEFQQRYRAELDNCKAALEELAQQASGNRVTLLYGARDREHNQAIVLKRFLDERLF